jgi:hypothetical protein
MKKLLLGIVLSLAAMSVYAERLNCTVEYDMMSDACKHQVAVDSGEEPQTALDVNHDIFSGACQQISNFNNTGIEKNSFEVGIEDLGNNGYHVQKYNNSDGKYYDCFAEDGYVSLYVGSHQVGVVAKQFVQ